MEAEGRRISSADARGAARTAARAVIRSGARAAALIAVAVQAALWLAVGADAQTIPPAAMDPVGTAPRGAAPAAWNSEAALRLAAHAIEARRHAWADSSLERFRADAEGHVYYLGDFLGEQHVIRADQIALDVRWQAPDRSLQTIIGRRHELRMPTNIRYHLDHLFLVLDNFGDRIRIGDGDEVEGVLHPAAVGALDFYDYRLADSLEIRVRDRTGRVFEVEVRPREGGAEGVVGSLFLERETGAITRMRITFTRAAYRDDQLVRIVLDLRSALWEGRHWLPVQQDLEITRSLPWLDFPLETVIRTRMRVLHYDFGEASGVDLGPGQYAYAHPGDALARFDDWASPLYGGPVDGASVETGDDDGDLTRLAERAGRELERAASDAGRLLPRQGLLGGRRLQLWLPNASAVIRARRAEGLLTGAGGSFRFDDATELSLWGGHALGDGRPQGSLQLWHRTGAIELQVAGWLRANRDVGRTVASGALRTLALLVEGEDYEDPYFVDGGRVGLVRETGSARWRVGTSVQRHRAAELVVGTTPLGERALRPVRPVDEGQLAALDAGLEVDLGRAAGARWALELAGEAATGTVGDFGFTRATVALRAARSGLGGGWGWASEIEFGAGGGDLPAQRLFLLGGRGTLPGHPFRGWGGDRVGLWRAEVSLPLAAPWMGLRAQGAVGWAAVGAAGEAAAERFGVGDSGGPRASAGIGVGLFYDLLRIDVARGLGGDAAAGDGWTLLLSLDPRIRSIL